MPKASQDTKDTLGQSLDGFDQPPQVATMISTTHNYNTTNAAQKSRAPAEFSWSLIEEFGVICMSDGFLIAPR